MYGRHGEAPLPVVAAHSPSHCFDAAFEAARIAIKYRTPVILLSDGYLANSAEPWLLPDVDELADISVPFATEPNHDGEFWPYLRDPETLARPWAIPGTPGLMHRIGGLEKADGSGNVEYDPANHELMCRLRAAEGGRHRQGHPAGRGRRPRRRASLLVLGWGSTWGQIKAALARRCAHAGKSVAHAHLDAPQPVPGQPRRGAGALRQGARARDEPRPAVANLRAEYLVDAVGLNQVRGIPFKAAEIEAKILEMLIHELSGDGRRRRATADDGAATLTGRTSSPTRRCAGARAAATTRCSPRCSCSCPTSA